MICKTDSLSAAGDAGGVAASAYGRLCRPRQHRMLCRPDFTRCYDTGRRFFSRLFVVFALRKDAPETAWRVGFAVTRKTGNAVTRNRVKRVLREFFRLHQGLMPPCVDVVVTPKRVLQPEHFRLDVACEELLPVLLQVSRWAEKGPSTACGIAGSGVQSVATHREEA